jgi:hypothetical protein
MWRMPKVKVLINFLNLSVPHEVKTSIFVGVCDIYPHMWRVLGVTNEVIHIFYFWMETGPMIISQRETDPLTVHSCNTETSYSKFSRNAAVNWTWTLWDGLSWWEEEPYHLPDTKLTWNSLSDEYYINMFYMMNLATDIIMSYMKGRTVFSRLPPTQWKHNRETMSAHVLSPELLNKFWWYGELGT